MADAMPELHYLSGADLERCLPGVEERLDLAGRALRALAHGTAEMPPKIGVHPRPGALLHAMPAWLRDGDLVGLKWIAAFPDNPARGLPTINGLVVLNDAATGVPTWIMDATRITAVRTAAVSGVALRLFAPKEVRRVALVGAGGVQGRSHTEVVQALLPSAEILKASSTDEAKEAARHAQVVITMAPLGAAKQLLTPDWLADGTLTISVDFATYASAALARDVGTFVVDDRAQFLAYRDAGSFDGYPEPSITLGELLDGEASGERTQPTEGSARLPALVNHLGVGLADVIFADAIRRRAEDLGAGQVLGR
jgi:ornithine cyclodeaminase/alanine dehydrogenase-like protein (mu-crystallin family)